LEVVNRGDGLEKITEVPISAVTHQMLAFVTEISRNFQVKVVLDHPIVIGIVQVFRDGLFIEGNRTA